MAISKDTYVMGGIAITVLAVAVTIGIVMQRENKEGMRGKETESNLPLSAIVRQKMVQYRDPRGLEFSRFIYLRDADGRLKGNLDYAAVD